MLVEKSKRRAHEEGYKKKKRIKREGRAAGKRRHPGDDVDSAGKDANVAAEAKGPLADAKAASRIRLSSKAYQKGFSPKRPARIYCDGIFDLFHYGHAKALEQAKRLRPYVYLLVGVCSDEVTHEKKGKTVFTERERYEALRHCKWVDKVIEDAPWVVDQDFLDAHSIDFVAHDGIPYVSDASDDVYSFVKKQGKFLATERTDDISTSDIITRIVRDYDEYCRRNLERGVTARELNLSIFKEGQLRVKKGLDKLKDRISETLKAGEGAIKQNWHGSKRELARALDYWESKSQEWIGDFTRLFDKNGPIAKIFGRKHQLDQLIDHLGSTSSAEEISPVSSHRSSMGTRRSD